MPMSMEIKICTHNQFSGILTFRITLFDCLHKTNWGLYNIQLSLTVNGHIYQITYDRRKVFVTSFCAQRTSLGNRNIKTLLNATIFQLLFGNKGCELHEILKYCFIDYALELFIYIYILHTCLILGFIQNKK